MNLKRLNEYFEFGFEKILAIGMLIIFVMFIYALNVFIEILEIEREIIRKGLIG
jgi:hypothetical protein